MRILLIHNYYQHRGGEDSVFEAEVELLKRNGQEVETLTFQNKAIQSKFDILNTGINSFFNRSSAELLENTITSFHPDVIHVHNFFPLASPSMFITAKKHFIPMVMTLHNFRLICSNALLYRNGKNCEECINKVFPLNGIQHACYRDSKLQSASVTAITGLHKLRGTWKSSIDRYIALNHFAREKFLNSSLNLTENQVVVKPNFVFDAFQNDPEIGSSKHKEDYFLFVGRLSVEKSVDTLLAAFKENGYSLKIIGSGPLEEEVRNTSLNFPNIQYLGFQNREFIFNTLKKAKALILPSSCYENFPMTIIEALSSGTPVVTSMIGGLPDIIQNGYNGYLMKPSSPQSLTEQCHRLLHDSKTYEMMCTNARDSYLSQFTDEINFKLLTDIYKQVILGRRRC